jgi:hypothetical protein
MMARMMEDNVYVGDTGPVETTRMPDGEIIEQFNKLEDDINKLHEEISNYLYETEPVRLAREDAPSEGVGVKDRMSEVEEIILRLRIKVGEMTRLVIEARGELRL